MACVLFEPLLSSRAAWRRYLVWISASDADGARPRTAYRPGSRARRGPSASETSGLATPFDSTMASGGVAAAAGVDGVSPGDDVAGLTDGGGVASAGSAVAPA